MAAEIKLGKNQPTGKGFRKLWRCKVISTRATQTSDQQFPQFLMKDKTCRFTRYLGILRKLCVNIGSG